MKHLALFTTLFLCINLVSQDIYQRVKLFPTTAEIESLQKAGIDVAEGYNFDEKYIESDYSKTEVEKIKQLVSNYTVLYKNSNEYYNQQRKKYKSAGNLDFSCFDSNEFPTPQNFQLGSYGGFLSYSEILAHMDNMYSLYPNLISQKEQIGTFLTHQNHPIYHTIITGSTNVSTKPQILFNSIHHAREPMSVVQNIYFMYYLLENYGTNADVTYLMDNTEIHFVPVINPDGYLLNESLYSYDANTDTHEFAYFRKNGRDNNGDGIFNTQDGVDLNRNYGYEWGYDDEGSSSDPTSATYRGPAPFSEPETQAMKFLCESHNYVMAFNYHSYSNLLLYPWGYDYLATPDDNVFSNLSEIMTSQNDYEYGIAADVIYKANGDSDDWMYGEQSTKNKIFAFTPEVGTSGDGFYPAQNRILQLCKATIAQNMYALKCVHNYVEVKPQSLNAELTTVTGNLIFDYKKFGLAAGSNVVSVTSNDPNISISGTIDLGNQNMGDCGTMAFDYQLNGSLAYGTEIIYTVSVDNGAHIYQKDYSTNVTLGAAQGVETTLITFDDANDFIADNGWGLSSDNHSAPFSVTDSPGGASLDNQKNTLTIKDTFDLTNALYANLQFWTKFDTQDNHDFVEVLAYDVDSQSETVLCGKYSKFSPYQNFGYPSYFGHNNFDTWYNEKINLQDFIGSRIQVKFVYNSNLYINYDGFYLDDLSVEIAQKPALTTNYNCRVFLEGCYLSNATMRADITALIPNNQPFNTAPYNYQGNESIGTIPANMVDWVLVEARTGTPNENVRGTNIVEQRAAMLLSDGSLAGSNGLAGVDFFNLNDIDEYYFCIRHRNHLDILSNSSTTAQANINQDFTNNVNSVFGNNQIKQAADGRFTMYAGDYTQDGIILNTDFDLWKLQQAELYIYRSIDGNLDGNVSITDFDSWSLNQAKLGVAEIRE